MSEQGKKIVIAIGDVGAGHRVPANAIRQAIETLHPGLFHIEIIDFFRIRDPSPLPGGSEATIRSTSKKGFLNRINSGFWHLSNSRWLHPFERHFVRRRCANDYLEMLRREAPDLLITLHPYLSELLGIWRGELGFRHVAVLLELGSPMRASASSTFDLAVSPTESATQRLCQMGAPRSRIATGLFPFRPSLLSCRSRAEMAKELNLDPDKPVFLLCGGGISIASSSKLLKMLTVAGRQVVVLCGKDQRFLDSFRESFPESRSVRAIGFTDRVQDYYSLADLVITKPGASSVIEMELLGKRCLLTAPVGPQERGNLDYALQNPNFRYIGHSHTFLDSAIETMLLSPPSFSSRRRTSEPEELAARCLSLVL